MIIELTKTTIHSPQTPTQEDQSASETSAPEPPLDSFRSKTKPSNKTRCWEDEPEEAWEGTVTSLSSNWAPSKEEVKSVVCLFRGGI